MYLFRSLSSLWELGRQRGIARSCQVLSLAGVLMLSLGPVDNSLAQAEDLAPTASLCDWKRDYAFFTEEVKTVGKADVLPCETVSLKSKVAAADKPLPLSAAQTERSAFEAELRAMVAGYPIEAMVPAIAEYDRDIAGLIVGIAKKESNWGKRVPRTDAGDDCFNYWGFKGAGARGVAMGHGCFGEPEEAVQAIGKRLQELVALRKTSEPANLTIWKCGSSCATHSPESVRKWVSDVDLYYREIAQR